MAKRSAHPTTPTVYTVGHSTRSLDELVDMLRAHGVTAIADVRPLSQVAQHPHFNDDALAKSLPLQGIRYLPFPALGGRRRPLEGSPNTGWRSESFRGYADYMQTPVFRQAIDDLLRVAAQPTAIMCARGGAVAVSSVAHFRRIARAAAYVLDVMSHTTVAPSPDTLRARRRRQNSVPETDPRSRPVRLTPRRRRYIPAHAEPGLFAHFF